MHPILYSEFKEVLRAYKFILLFIFIMLVSRATLGDYGHIINLFIIFPMIAGGLGTGLLSEEYSKDYMKYLYTLPIKRWHFIFVKMIFTIIAAAAFLLIIYIIKWLIPPRLSIPTFFFSTVFNLKYVFLFTMAIAFFNYATCSFAITFLKSPKMAGNLNYLSLVIAFIYLLYCFLESGYKYKTVDYMLIFIPVAVILFAGGFYLFTLRNPFLNKNPRHFLTGVSIIVISISCFAGITQFIIQRQENGIFEVNKLADNMKFNKGVEYYSVSPDGELVYVEMAPDNLIVHSCIFDASGELVADLGKYSSTYNYYDPWQFSNGKRMIMYKKEKPLLSEISARKFIDYYVLDIDEQKQYTFKPFSENNSGGYKHQRLNCDTLEHTGVCFSDPFDTDAGLSYFTHNLITDDVEKFPIPDSQGARPYDVEYVDSQYIAFKKNPYEATMNEGSQLYVNIFDIEEGKIHKVLLPETASYGNCIVNTDKCFFFKELSDEYGYSYQFIERTIDGSDIIHLTPDELPKFSYKEASKQHRDAGGSLSFSPQKKWLKCYYNDPERQRRLMLLDMENEGKRVDIEIDFESCRSIIFAPGDMRFCAVLGYMEDDELIRKEAHIYDIVGQNITLHKKFELELGKGISDIQFLDAKNLLYSKDPTPSDEWRNNTYLVKINLESLEKTSFISSK